mmetsp:Transcript_29792/g.28961  ORF Transcript_29792/g.28961 Transcript_29792/m.28961 type:complete len:85 (+) Transcript_29792:1595-1849(+)
MRQMDYLQKLFNLYRNKDNEIDYMAQKLYRMREEQQFVTARRNLAFKGLGEMLVERRRMLGVVHQNATLMGMVFNSKNEASMAR